MGFTPRRCSLTNNKQQSRKPVPSQCTPFSLQQCMRRAIEFENQQSVVSRHRQRTDSPPTVSHRSSQVPARRSASDKKSWVLDGNVGVCVYACYSAYGHFKPKTTFPLLSIILVEKGKSSVQHGSRWSCSWRRAASNISRIHNTHPIVEYEFRQGKSIVSARMCAYLVDARVETIAENSHSHWRLGQAHSVRPPFIIQG